MGGLGARRPDEPVRPRPSIVYAVGVLLARVAVGLCPRDAAGVVEGPIGPPFVGRDREAVPVVRLSGGLAVCQAARPILISSSL